MTPAADDGPGPTLEGIGPSELQLFQSEMCITNEPTEDGEPLTSLEFLPDSRWLESDPEKIETVKILPGSRASCKCRAKKDGTQGLRDLCLCRDG